MKKIDVAIEIFNKNAGKSRAEVISKIMEKLQVTKGNASIYYNKANSRTEQKIEPVIVEVPEVTSNVVEIVNTGKYANNEIRETIEAIIADTKDIPEFLLKA